VILVSACLLGIDCKFNGGNNKIEDIGDLLKEEVVIPICPEQLGGLSTPRNPSEIIIKDGNKYVLDNKGNDLTANFIKGAEETLKIAKLYNIEEAVLKSNSPSCGLGLIYDGSFSGELTEGEGVTASYLIKNKVKVYNEFNYKEKLK
jgi:uncharacterized protein YbbK (DUF523 family)